MIRHPLQAGQRDNLAKMSRIAVLRVVQLGDLLAVVPALRALRAAAPDTQITLIGLPWASGFAQRFSDYIDDFISFPGYPGLTESTPDRTLLPEFLRIAQQRNFDLAIQLHDSGTITNPVIELLNSERVAGYYRVGEFCPDAERFLPWSASEHEVKRAVDLMEFLGAPSQGTALEFPLYDADYRALWHAHQNLPEPGTYACIHPGARLPSRRWIAQHYAEVADRLAEQGLHIVVTGTASERCVAEAMLSHMQAPAVNMTGKTGLGSFAALISNAAIIVCNATSVSEIAVAVDTPSVVICSGADTGRGTPLARSRHRMITIDIACRPCSYVTCPIGHPCAAGVSVASVMTAADELLEKHAMPGNPLLA